MKITLAVMTLLVVLDPILTKVLGDFFNYNNGIYSDNAYVNWLLYPVSLIAGTVFFCLLNILPVLFTGMLFFWESSSSVYPFKIVKVGRFKYLISKIFSTFSVSFLNSFFILSINLIACFAVFSFSGSQETIYQFTDYVPRENTFAYYFFNINPLLMAVFYNFLAALGIALSSVIALSLQMIFKFNNPFLAFLIPVLVLYIIDFIPEITLPPQLVISQIIQPGHASSPYRPYMTADSVAITYILYTAFAALLAYIGIKRNGEYV